MAEVGAEVSTAVGGKDTKRRTGVNEALCGGEQPAQGHRLRFQK